jgi:hypothetical protein
MRDPRSPAAIVSAMTNLIEPHIAAEASLTATGRRARAEAISCWTSVIAIESDAIGSPAESHTSSRHSAPSRSKASPISVG